MAHHLLTRRTVFCEACVSPGFREEKDSPRLDQTCWLVRLSCPASFSGLLGFLWAFTRVPDSPEHGVSLLDWSEPPATWKSVQSLRLRFQQSLPWKCFPHLFEPRCAAHPSLWGADKQRSDSSGCRDVSFWFSVLPSSRNVVFPSPNYFPAGDTL